MQNKFIKSDRLVILSILLLIIAPLAYNFGMSFTNWTMSTVKAPEFIAFDNYIILYI